MNHGMAVRAQRDQLVHRVNLIVSPECSQRPDMMNVDKPFPVLTPDSLKIESAALTDGAMIRNTGPPVGRVPFIRVNCDGFCSALDIAAGDGQLFGVRTGRKVGVPGGSLDIENYCTIRASPACQRRCLRFLSALQLEIKGRDCGTINGHGESSSIRALMKDAREALVR